MVKRRHENACLFDDDGGNQNNGAVGAITTDKVVTPPTRDTFLQAYGPSKLCVTTVACLWLQVHKTGEALLC